MFYKGLVTYYDAVTKEGRIVLSHDEKEIIFAVEDFPNPRIVPHVGERVKCFIAEKMAFYAQI